MLHRTALPALMVSLVVTGTASAQSQPAKKAETSAPRRLEWSTTSEAARTATHDALRKYAAMAPMTQVRDAAQKAVDADAQFAFGWYLLASSAPRDRVKAHLDKAAELAAKASEGERKFVEAFQLQHGGAARRDEALAAFEKLAGTYPDEPLVHLQLGQLYQDAGRFDPARQELEKAVALDPESARALTALGNTLVLLGDYAGARARFELAVTKLAPEAPTASIRNNLARCYLYEGRPEDAAKTVQLAIEEYPRAPAGFPIVGLWNALARIYLEHGKADEALATYEKGFESVKTSTLPERQKRIWEGRLHHGRGRSLARMGKKEAAWAEAEIVRGMIESAGEDGKEFVPAYHYLAAYLKLESGETEAALEHLKQSDPEHDAFRMLLLARTYERLGQKEKARETYQEIVDSKQNNLERALAYNEAKKKLL